MQQAVKQSLSKGEQEAFKKWRRGDEERRRIEPIESQNSAKVATYSPPLLFPSS